ncbi:MAG: hypothetical protein CVT89_06695 [Candidatus Altiarchaeales archaeon HGW-Altiarchaeales-2]|nr:MAG: hypothetical protein CVT89_06695 [Candidatus Altiarchaeales archaeon HGW-Altiarchaeales-2]
MQYVEISSDFSAAHFLESEYIHGHNFKITAKFYGNLDKDGRQIDFDKAKETLDDICNEFDHKVMLPLSAENRKDNAATNKISVQGKNYEIPNDDIAFIPIRATTAEYVAEYIVNRLKEKFKSKNLKISVELEENYDSSATFFD